VGILGHSVWGSWVTHTHTQDNSYGLMIASKSIVYLLSENSDYLTPHIILHTQREVYYCGVYSSPIGNGLTAESNCF
jgi:hypothetical protein